MDYPKGVIEREVKGDIVVQDEGGIEVEGGIYRHRRLCGSGDGGHRRR